MLELLNVLLYVQTLKVYIFFYIGNVLL